MNNISFTFYLIFFYATYNISLAGDIVWMKGGNSNVLSERVYGYDQVIISDDESFLYYEGRNSSTIYSLNDKLVFSIFDWNNFQKNFLGKIFFSEDNSMIYKTGRRIEYKYLDNLAKSDTIVLMTESDEFIINSSTIFDTDKLLAIGYWSKDEDEKYFTIWGLANLELIRSQIIDFESDFDLFDLDIQVSIDNQLFSIDKLGTGSLDVDHGVYDISTGKKVHTLDRLTDYCYFSSNGLFVEHYSISPKIEYSVYDINNWNLINKYKIKENAYKYSLNDNKTAMLTIDRDNEKISIIDLRTGIEIDSYPYLTALHPSSNDSDYEILYLLSTKENGSIIFGNFLSNGSTLFYNDPDPSKNFEIIGYAPTCSDITFSQDGEYVLVSSYTSKAISVYRASDGKLLNQFHDFGSKDHYPHQKIVTGYNNFLGIEPGGKYYVYVDDFLNDEDRKVRRINGDYNILDFDVSENGEYTAITDYNSKQIIVLDKNDQIISTLSVPEHIMYIVEFIDNDKIMALSYTSHITMDLHFIEWDFLQGSNSYEIEFIGLYEDIQKNQYSYSDNLLKFSTNGWVYDLEEFARGYFDFDDLTVEDNVIFNDGKNILLGVASRRSEEDSLRLFVYNIEKFNHNTTLQAIDTIHLGRNFQYGYSDDNHPRDLFVSSVAISPDNKLAVAGTQNGTIICFKLDDYLTSVDNLSIEGEEFFSIYPTPAISQLTIQLNNNQFIDRCEMEIRNILGEVVERKTIDFQSSSLYNFNTSNFSSGIYYLNIKSNLNEEIIFSDKFLITK